MLQRNDALIGARSLRRHVLVGCAVLIGLVGGLGWWSASTQVAGAIVASGNIVVEGGAKRVQHPDGGVVAGIEVNDGDWVDAGDVLFRLDDTRVAASLNIVLSQLRDAYTRLARLNGELLEATAPIAIDDVPSTLAGAEFEQLLQTQQSLMTARAQARAGRRDQIVEQTNQLRKKIDGLAAQRSAAEAQIVVVAAETGDLEQLRGEGLVSSSRVNELVSRRLQLDGSIGQLTASIAETEATISELETVLSLESDQLLTEVLGDQQTARAQVAELSQQQIALQAQLAKLEMRAPIAGIVHSSAVHTVGGVVAAGETAMLIVPRIEGASVHVRINPLDIDAVNGAQEVLIKLPGLSARASPDLVGRIEWVSPDLTSEPNGVQYYLARIVIDRDELARLPDHVPVVAGMPAEAFIKTSDRTVLDFLLKPITELVERTFRED
jgi:HlyD family secretion protein